jgi:hypothetical protein
VVYALLDDAVSIRINDSVVPVNLTENKNPLIRPLREVLK